VKFFSGQSFCLRAVAAFALVGAQLVVHDSLISVLGWKAQTILAANFLSLLGFAMGCGGWISARAGRVVFFLAAVLAIGLGALQPRLAEITANSSTVSMGALAALFFIVLSSGLSFALAMGESSRSQTYRATNFLAAISLTVSAPLLWRFGYPPAFVTLGLIYACCGAFLNFDFKPVARFWQWPSPNEVNTAFLGFFAAGFLCLYFESIHLSINPIGIEYPVFLFLTFLILGTSPSSFARSSFGLAFFGVSAAILSFLLLPRVFLFLPAGNPSLLAALVLLVGFWPYFLFSGAIPMQEKMAPGQRHLFFSCMGNLAGLSVFAWLLGSRPISLTLIFLALAAALYQVWQKRIHYAVSLLAVACLPLIFNPELPWIKLAHASTPSHSSTIPKGDLSALRVSHLTRVSGETGFLMDFGTPLTQRLYLGAYSSRMHQTYDVLRALLAVDSLPADAKQVVLLGLGSHATLSALRNALNRRGMDHVVIYVVDNFSPFQNISFRNSVAKETGFDWTQGLEHTEFIAEDVVKFILSTKAGTYDAVIWNLTMPEFGKANRIFTLDFMQGIGRSLRENGIFVTNNFPGGLAQCLFSQVAAHSYLIPRRTPQPFGLMLVQRKTLQMKEESIACEKEDLPNFSRPFQTTFNEQWAFEGKISDRLEPGGLSIPPSLGGSSTERFSRAQIERTNFWVSDTASIRANSLFLPSFAADSYQAIIAMALYWQNPGLNIFLASSAANQLWQEAWGDPISRRKNTGDVWFLNPVSKAMDVKIPVFGNSRPNRDANVDFEITIKQSTAFVPWPPDSEAICGFAKKYFQETGKPVSLRHYFFESLLRGETNFGRWKWKRFNSELPCT